MSDDTPNPIVLGLRRPGRPRVDTPRTTPASVRIPTADYDRLSALAVRHDIPVSTFLREVLALYLRDDG